MSCGLEGSRHLHSHVWGPGGAGWRAGLSLTSLLLQVVLGLSMWHFQQTLSLLTWQLRALRASVPKRGEIEPANLLRPELRRHDITFPIFYFVKAVTGPTAFKIMPSHSYSKVGDIDPPSWWPSLICPIHRVLRFGIDPLSLS